MAQYVPIIATSFIPFTSLISFSVYLSTHPSSPAKALFRKDRIALPTHHEEPLTTEKDPFDIYDDKILQDGKPVQAEAFWRSMWRRKVALLATMLLPFIANIVLFIFTIIQGDSVLPPALLLPSHIVTLILSLLFLSQHDTPSHWSTTIHLACGIFVQFIVLSVIALLPSEPFPSRPISFHPVFFHSLIQLPTEPIPILRSLLPILHIPPLLIVMYIRRGPPLYVPLDLIYPPKITEAIPKDHPSVDPSQANVCEEVQATIPEWLLFGYVTNVVKKGYAAETMDVWDLPILTTDMRKSPRFVVCSCSSSGALACYRAFKRVYGRRTKRVQREGYNLLLKIAKTNIRPLIAREWSSYMR